MLLLYNRPCPRCQPCHTAHGSRQPLQYTVQTRVPTRPTHSAGITIATAEKGRVEERRDERISEPKTGRCRDHSFSTSRRRTSPPSPETLRLALLFWSATFAIIRPRRRQHHVEVLFAVRHARQQFLHVKSAGNGGTSDRFT